MNDEGHKRWDDRRKSMLEFILAVSAVPSWLALVGVVLYVAVPAIETTNRITSVVEQLEQRVTYHDKLAEIHSAQLRDLLQSNITQTERLTALTVRVQAQDHRIEKIEDNVRPWWKLPKADK